MQVDASLVHTGEVPAGYGPANALSFVVPWPDARIEDADGPQTVHVASLGACTRITVESPQFPLRLVAADPNGQE